MTEDKKHWWEDYGYDDEEKLAYYLRDCMPQEKVTFTMQVISTDHGDSGILCVDEPDYVAIRGFVCGENGEDFSAPNTPMWDRYLSVDVWVKKETALKMGLKLSEDKYEGYHYEKEEKPVLTLTVQTVGIEPSEEFAICRELGTDIDPGYEWGN